MHTQNPASTNLDTANGHHTRQLNPKAHDPRFGGNTAMGRWPKLRLNSSLCMRTCFRLQTKCEGAAWGVCAHAKQKNAQTNDCRTTEWKHEHKYKQSKTRLGALTVGASQTPGTRKVPYPNTCPRMSNVFRTIAHVHPTLRTR